MPPLRLFVESGAEYLLPFAKRKLELLKRRALAAKQRVASANYTVSTGERIFVQTVRAAKTVLDTIRLNAAVRGFFRALREPPDEDGTHFYRTNTTVLLEKNTNARLRPVGPVYVDADWSQSGATYAEMVVDPSSASTTLSLTRAGVTVEIENVWGQLPATSFTDYLGRFADLTFEARAFRHQSDRLESTPPFVISRGGTRVVALSSVYDELFVVADWNSTTQTFDVTRVSVPPTYVSRRDALASGSGSYTPNDPDQYGTMSWVDAGFTTPIDGGVGDYVSPPGDFISRSYDIQAQAVLHPHTTRKMYFMYRLEGLPSATVPFVYAFAAPGTRVTALAVNYGTAYTSIMEYDADELTWTEIALQETPIIDLGASGTVGWSPSNPLPKPHVLSTGRLPSWFHLLLSPDGAATVVETPYAAQEDEVLSFQPYPSGPVFDFNLRNTASNENILASIDASIDGTVVSENWACLPTSYAGADNDYWQSAPGGRFLFKSISSGSSPPGSKSGWIWRYSATGELVIDAADTRTKFLSKDGSWLFLTGTTDEVMIDGVSVWTSASLPAAYTNLVFLAPSMQHNNTIFGTATKDAATVLVSCAFAPDSTGAYQIAITDINKSFVVTPAGEANFPVQGGYVHIDTFGDAPVPSADPPTDGFSLDGTLYWTGDPLTSLTEAEFSAIVGLTCTFHPDGVTFYNIGATAEVVADLDSLTPDECFPNPA